jgi:LysR family transcriptional activator of dmlA
LDRADLELVLAIRDHGSLSGAAGALGLAAPAVTKRLASLESHLGVRLFQRTTRRVSATGEGEAICERAQHLLRGFQDLEAELQERQTEPAGVIRLVSNIRIRPAVGGAGTCQLPAKVPSPVRPVAADGAVARTRRTGL